MAIVRGRKIEYSLRYDEHDGCWVMRIQKSNRNGFTKRFRTCKQANEWYDRYLEKWNNPSLHEDIYL